MAAQALGIERHIAVDEGICGGEPRIAGTRIKVRHVVVEYERRGLSPDEICDLHPGLTLAAVHSAIAYYYEHRDEMLEAIRRDEGFAVTVKRRLEFTSTGLFPGSGAVDSMPK
jgi:uncharacterized protein (DUF433 family)